MSNIDPTKISTEVADKYQIIDNAFSFLPKDDPKDRIKVEIGDSKVPDDFLPQLKVMRWDNEVNASFRLKHNETNLQLLTEGEKIKWVGKKIEANFYTIDKKKETLPIINTSSIRKISLKNVPAIYYPGAWELYAKKAPSSLSIIDINFGEQFLNCANRFDWNDVNTGALQRTRLYTRGQGYKPYLVDSGAWYFFLTVPKGANSFAIAMAESIKEIAEEKGVEVKIEGNDILFKDGEKWKKFSGLMQIDWNGCRTILTGFTFNLDAEKAKSIYGPDITDSVGGLSEVIDNIIPEDFKNEIIERFGQKLNTPIVEDTLSVDEQATISATDMSDEWVNDAERPDLYDFEPKRIHKEGAYEFEVLLKEKPITNKIEFTLNTKGVKFLYQGELTKEEKKKGHYRPQDVIGSYAIYALEKKINWKGGKEYKCSKIGHLFYPYLVDANGWKVRAEDFNITTNPDGTGLLRVVAPQDFLDNAVYPIKHAAGLTFGYTTGGTTGGIIIAANAGNSYRVGAAFTPAQAGTLDSLHCYLASNLVAADWVLDLAMHLNIENAATNSHNQVAEVERLNVSVPVGVDWYVFNANDESFDAVSHIISILGDAADLSEKSSSTLVYYDSGGSSTNKYNEAGVYATLRDEDPWTEDEAADENQYSLYATYSAAGPANIASINGIAIANVASVNSIAKASIETINGIS